MTTWILAGALVLVATIARTAEKPRLVVLTDIGGDPDDQQSMVRLMLYANEMDIEGLLATDRNEPERIIEIVDAYEQVRPRLLEHAPGYPKADALRSITKVGLPNSRTVGSLGTDTEASDWIISVVDRDDPRPVDIAVWGGPGELAQALWRVREDRTANEVAEFISRIRVHAIDHQDETGAWILESFPGIWYILDNSQTGDKHVSCYRGMWKHGDRSLTSLAWLDEHVRHRHGPLGAAYPPRTAAPPENALKEGDTPSWFYFLPHGFNDPTEPTWGGRGGRFQPEDGYIRDAQDTVGDETSRMATIWRWRQAYQNEFQARLDWCVKPFGEANHSPAAVLNGDRSRDVVRISKRGGKRVKLSAARSTDPDGDALAFKWFIYPEPGTYDGEVELQGAGSETARFVAPRVDEPATIHVVLQTTDDGDPSLHSFRRAVVTVKPG